jgi:hypothetical protein
MIAINNGEVIGKIVMARRELEDALFTYIDTIDDQDKDHIQYCIQCLEESANDRRTGWSFSNIPVVDQLKITLEQIMLIKEQALNYVGYLPQIIRCINIIEKLIKEME